MFLPLSTEYPTAEILILRRLANSVSEIPNSRTAQKQKRLRGFTFFYCLPLMKTSSTPISKISAFIIPEHISTLYSPDHNVIKYTGRVQSG